MLSVRSCALVACWLACIPSTLLAQTNPDTERLRQQVQLLQDQLNALDAANRAAATPKVTQLGTTSNPRSKEPQLILRMYDLSDLFAIAPPYPAYFAPELGGGGGPAFPSVGGTQSIGLNGASGGAGSWGMGGGGMGMGGMGGMGGGGGYFFNVHDRPAGSPPGATKPTEAPKKRLPAEGAHALYQNGGDSSSASLGARTSLEDLMEAVTTSVSPQSWDTVGGQQSISRVGNVLLVNADESSHDKIDALVGQFRKRWGTLRTIAVQAWWLWLSDEQLAALIPDDREAPFGPVEAKPWQQLMEQLRAPDRKGPLGYRASITSYNGQTVNTISEGQSLAITSLDPVGLDGFLGNPVDVKEKPVGRVAYRPTMTNLKEGTVLQVTPLANLSGKIVVLDVHSRVAKLAESRMAAAGDARPAEAAAGPPTAIDRPRMLTQRLSTTLRVPVGRPTLVGGMSFEGQAAPSTLYLFVRVSVQELRDDVKPGEKAEK